MTTTNMTTTYMTASPAVPPPRGLAPHAQPEGHVPRFQHPARGADDGGEHVYIHVPFLACMGPRIAAHVHANPTYCILAPCTTATTIVQPRLSLLPLLLLQPLLIPPLLLQPHYHIYHDTSTRYQQ